MADTALTGLTAAVAVADTDLFYMAVTGPLSRKITFLDVEDSMRLASGAVDGFMALADKTKIDGIASGAEVNVDEFVDNVFRINDNITPTKQLAFQVSAIAAITTRTWTAPDQDLDLTPGTGSFATEAEGNLAATSLQPADIGGTVQAFGLVLDDFNLLGTVPGDGDFIVGTGAGTFGYENGSTARVSMGAQTQGDVLDDFNALGAAVSDGQFIVATGPGVFAYEVPSVARTSLGLGTFAVESIAAAPAITYAGIQSYADNLLDQPLLRDYAEAVDVDATATGAQVIDIELGNIVDWTLTGNVTAITINNWPASGRHGKVTLYITQGAGPFTITWPAAVSWAGDGSPPDLSPTSGDKDVIVLTTLDGGTSIYGFHTGTDL